MWIYIVIGWVVCLVFSYTLTRYDAYRHEEDWTLKHRWFLLGFSCFGPISVIIFISIWITENAKWDKKVGW